MKPEISLKKSWGGYRRTPQGYTPPPKKPQMHPAHRRDYRVHSAPLPASGFFAGNQPSVEPCSHLRRSNSEYTRRRWVSRPIDYTGQGINDAVLVSVQGRAYQQGRRSCRALRSRGLQREIPVKEESPGRLRCSTSAALENTAHAGRIRGAPACVDFF